ncbi:hypothetical protein GQ55_8G088000 [Panicum hallii var. hallii]|uniref:AP2/ERF domain-containing protein n=1 Tax=Panicum hallii var. hallii TaxID=1504633 RepID=A0A2T7CM50_9POAL|nr:hypothetical protein GQ55_8G088000 [Panicum hallii var. hallii]
MGSTNNWLGFASFSGAAAADDILPPQPPPRGDEADAEPKLEDFLGLQGPAAAVAGRPFAGSGGGASSIGLSMIKNWLRSQPAPGPTGADSMALAAVQAASTDGSGKVADGAVSDAAVVDAAPQRKAVAAVDTFGQRTSIYRGVTKHRWTGRYEAHLWDNSCRREGQTRKGRQVYLGGYDKEEKAARAYDLAALKYWGTTTTTNFPMSNYENELEEMKHMSRQEYVASLRRKSSGFSRGASIYRGVTRHHQHGRWQARIGRVAGNKDLYLGTFSTQEEAAEAYDIAAIKFRGLNAVTNFDMSRYDVKSIMESSALPVGGTTKRLKDVPDQADMGMNSNVADSAGHMTATKLLTDGIGSYGHENYGYSGWSASAMTPIPLQFSNCHDRSRLWCKPEQDSAVVAAAHNLHHLQHFPDPGGTHNFFHPSPGQDVTAVTNVSSPSVGSNSFLYSGDVGYHGAMGGGYAIPVATLVDSNHAASGYGVEEGTSDLYSGRNLYYLSQASPGTNTGKADAYEQQGVGYESWVPSVPVISQKDANVTVCHGTPLFSVWK